MHRSFVSEIGDSQKQVVVIRLPLRVARRGVERWHLWIWGSLVIAAWKKGGAAGRTHGAPQECVPAPLGGGATQCDRAIWPVSGEPAGHGGAADRGLGDADGAGLWSPACAGDPG